MATLILGIEINNMRVESKIHLDVLTIKIFGRFDFETHLQMREAINMVRAGLRQIVVDLSQTDYLDSSALGMLLVLRDKVADGKQGISIQGARSEVKKILEIANFDKLFTLT